MRFCALATDYDGTLAHDGRVSDRTIEALGRLKESGRRLLMVTGRELRELLAIFPPADLFDLIVAENGALLYFPGERREQPIAPPPPDALVRALQERAVSPLSIGRVIVASWETEAPKILDAIHALGLEMQLIFNKGSLMVLPSGVNKASGLAAALDYLCLSPHNVAGIGDAENDHAFLSACECGIAVANALPSLKEHADIVTKGDHGDGVIELIDHLIADDLASVAARLSRYDLLLGAAGDRDVRFPAYGHSLMVAGSSGGGKSELTTGFCERLLDAGYQLCIVDPEGDHESLGSAVVVDKTDEAVKLLEKPERSAIVNMVHVRFEDRPGFFHALLPKLLELRARTGRPHWIVVDEAHHVLPDVREAAPLPEGITNLALITVRPDHVRRSAVGLTDSLIVVGKEPDAAASAWAKATGAPASPSGVDELERGEALFWRKSEPAPLRFRVAPSTIERVRHNRKYATGDVAPNEFYFRGSEGKLNLRAQNLITFLQMAEGVDDETWVHHLRQGDYSKWFGSAIHSDELAEDARAIEKDAGLSPAESRKRIREAIENRFTLAA